MFDYTQSQAKSTTYVLQRISLAVQPDNVVAILGYSFCFVLFYLLVLVFPSINPFPLPPLSLLLFP